MAIITTTGTLAYRQAGPSLLLVCEGVLHLTGAPLDDFASMLFVRSGKTANVFTYSAYSTSTGSPADSYRLPPASSGLPNFVPNLSVAFSKGEGKWNETFLRLSVSPGGFIPDAANTSGTAVGADSMKRR